MKKNILGLALCLFSSAIVAQEHDWGGIVSVDIEKKLNKTWTFSFEEEMRLNNNLSDVERFSHTLGVDYKFSKFIKAGASYTLMQKNTHYEKIFNNTLFIKDYWQARNRVSMFVTGTYKYEYFKFSLRERYQYTSWDKKKYKKVNDVKQWTEESRNSSIVRSRLQVAYEKKDIKWEPFVSVELFHLLKCDTYIDDNDVEEKSLDEIRFVIGTSYQINKKNEIEIFFRHDNNQNEENEDISRIGLGYAFKF